MFYLFEEEGVHYYELIMGDEDVNIGVAYKKTGPLYVNALAGPEHSTITWTPQKPYFLDTVTVTIIPDPGYRLVRAVAASHAGDFISELTPIGGNKYTFTMHPGGVELYVTFEAVLNNVTVKAGPGGTAKADVSQAKVGDTVTAAGLTFQVLHTPGHTPGGVCLLCEEAMFAGDTLFAGTCGRTDLPGSSPRQMRESLSRLAKLEKNYRVLPGHGIYSTLDMEKRTNPYLQWN